MPRPTNVRKHVDEDVPLINNLDLVFTPTKKQCQMMLRSWTQAPYYFTHAQIAAMHGVPPGTMTNWMGNDDAGISRPCTKLIWVLYTLKKEPKKLDSIRSLCTYGRLP